MRKVIQKQKIEVICDICKKHCHPSKTCPEAIESANLTANWGYWSNNKDTQKFDIDFCENCFNDFLRWAKSKGAKIVPKFYL